MANVSEALITIACETNSKKSGKDHYVGFHLGESKQQGFKRTVQVYDPTLADL
jgi:hypothetical protein